MICSHCKTPCDAERSVIKGMEIFSGCNNCLPSQMQQGHEGAARYYRDQQKIDYRREITQPSDPNFIKAYPKEASEYYDEETIRKLS